jgi:hypothetical protein
MLQVTSQSAVRRGVLGIGVAVMMAVTSGAVTHATTMGNHPNIITFSKAVTLPGRVLPAGTYVFEVANPTASHDVIRVLDKASGRSLYMGFTRPVSRPASMSQEQAVSFNEAASGQPAPVRAWYPIGFRDGHEFIYR